VRVGVVVGVRDRVRVRCERSKGRESGYCSVRGRGCSRVRVSGDRIRVKVRVRVSGVRVKVSWSVYSFIRCGFERRFIRVRVRVRFLVRGVIIEGLGLERS
jgi:hypothetical protein